MRSEIKSVWLRWLTAGWLLAGAIGARAAVNGVLESRSSRGDEAQIKAESGKQKSENIQSLLTSAATVSFIPPPVTK
jgi:hypothetical protein